MVRRVRRHLAEYAQVSPGPERTFLEAIRLFNDLWFLPRGLILCRFNWESLPEVDEPAWNMDCLALARVADCTAYRFDDLTVQVHLIRWLFPHPPGKALPTHYDRALQHVVIELNRLLYVTLSDHEFGTAWLFGPSAIGMAHRRYLRYLAFAHRRFADPVQYYHFQFIRTLVEELRHAVNAARTGFRVGELQDEYYCRLATTLLDEEGILWEWVESQSDDQRWEAGMVISELSANLAAAAVGPDPKMLVEEWRYLLETTPEESPFSDLTPDRHYLASGWALALLAEECGLHSDGVNDVSFQDCADQLVSLPAGFLRQRLKSVFAREFKHPVDERPFPEIGLYGLLYWRTEGQKTAYERALPNGDPHKTLRFRRRLRRKVEQVVVRRIFSQLVVQVFHSLRDAGYNISHYSCGLGRLTARLTAVTRSSPPQGLWCTTWKRGSKRRDRFVVETPELALGQSGTIEIPARRLRGVAVIQFDVPFGELWHPNL